MINVNTSKLQDWLTRESIGYDLLNRLIPADIQKYPPHNIIMYSEDKYKLTLAVAGFAKSELEVEVSEGYLHIRGTKTEAEGSEDVTVLHRGISSRDFERSWKLGEYVEIAGVALKDGLLSVDLERKLPEAKKARKVDIQ